MDILLINDKYGGLKLHAVIYMQFFVEFSFMVKKRKKIFFLFIFAP